MTPNVVTLWYRAPEVLLGSEEYDESIEYVNVPCCSCDDRGRVGCLLPLLRRCSFGAQHFLSRGHIDIASLSGPPSRVMSELCFSPVAASALTALNELPLLLMLLLVLRMSDIACGAVVQFLPNWCPGSHCFRRPRRANALI